MKRHERIQHSFARALKHYDHHAFVQADIAKHLMAHFKEATSETRFNSILEFGCGTGLLTQHLSQYAFQSLLLNDLVPASEKPLNELFSNGRDNWEFLAGAIENLPLRQNFDLIASSSTIQWIDDVSHLLKQLIDHLHPMGWLVMSGFGRQHFHEIRTTVSQPNTLSYLDADDWRECLEGTLTLKVLKQEQVTLHFPDMFDLLHHLRKTGVNAIASANWSRGQLQTFMKTYERRYREDKGVRLTYEPVYIIAQKNP